MTETAVSVTNLGITMVQLYVYVRHGGPLRRQACATVGQRSTSIKTVSSC